MEEQYIAFVQDVLITVHENIRELNERKGFADPAELSHIEGKLIAYHEMLAILKVSAEEFKIPKEKIGI
jgi:hypothetical protein